jgi:hypothetical protein
VPHYHAFGLKLDSQIELPELQRGTGPGDVVIRRGERAPASDDEGAEGGWLGGGGERLVLRLEDMVFTVEGGRSIEIAAPTGKGDNDIRVWLLGTVMAALLHQRGYFCLHANMIRLPSGGVAAFCGPSGAGKSTMAGLLDRAGFDVLGDDLCATRIDAAGRPVIYRGIPRLKLWETTLALLDRSSDALEKVASDLDKFHVPLDSVDDVGELAPLPLERLYLLDRRDQADGALIVPVTGVGAAGIVLDNSFRWSIGQSVAGRDSRVQFDQALAIARGAAVFRLARRWGEDYVRTEAGEVAAHLSASLTNSVAADGVGS